MTSLDDRVADLERRVAALEEKDERATRRVALKTFLPFDVVKPVWEDYIRAGMTPEQIKAEYTRFFNHAESVGRRCAGLPGWQAAFRNWMARQPR